MAEGPAVSGGRTIDALLRQLEAAKAERDAAQAREAALTEILQAVNASSGDLEPVFDAILEKATQLCDASFGAFSLYRGDDVHEIITSRNVPAALFTGTNRFGPKTGMGRLARGAPYVHIADASDDEGYRQGNPVRRALVDEAKAIGLAIPPNLRDVADRIIE